MAAVAIMKRLRAIYREPIDLLTTPHCAAAVPLLMEEPELIGSVSIQEDYRPTATQPGLQPIALPIPRELLRDGHRDVFHLGFRRFPLPHEDLAACMGSSYGLADWSGGPWLRPARLDKKGHIIAHAPVEQQENQAPLRELLAQVRGRDVVIVGTSREFVIYQQMELDQIPGVTLRHVDNCLDIWEACQGAAGFTGISSSPAMVCAGAGLPSKWVLQRGGNSWCAPRGCDVRIIGEVRSVGPN